MHFKRDFPFFRKFRRGHSRKLKNCIHARHSFRTILQKEQARANRFGHNFTLLAVDLGNRVRDDLLVCSVIQILTKRIRLIDEVGWLNKANIGVLLPNTNREGAQIFIDEIQKIMDQEHFVPHKIKICHYSIKSPLIEENNEDNKQNKKNCNFFVFKNIPIWKNVLDLAGSILGVFLLSPLMIFIGIAIKINSKGPILFKQIRIGYGEKPFRILKFRTMEDNANDSIHKEYLFNLIQDKADKNDNNRYKLKDDPRVTSVGRILRKWSLDEMPQLFNVLAGDMSLVGPRPEPFYAKSAYRHWYHTRTMITKPGVTGLWQVEARSQVKFEEMVRLDIRYCQSMSLIHDLKLLFRTFRAVLSRNGAY